MVVFSRSLTKARQCHHHYQPCRTLTEISTIKRVRDRGLDHAVEKEKDLRPMLNAKNFIKSEPSKSLPINIVAENREALQIRVRAVDFLRKYPSVFEEFFPGNVAIHPHFRLTSETLNVDSDEQLIYQSDKYKQEAADRLLKLLMLCRINKLPLSMVDRFQWDLGLPRNYTETLIPEFPDYFQIVADKDCAFRSEDTRALELVCWNNELAVSVLEKKVRNREMHYERGMPISFPLQYSRDFQMDKKFKKWMDGWQKLPYISPYENASHLPPKSDESDKWSAAVMHELLHILVPKKMEWDSILCFGEYTGIRARFKRALLNHPGIFYLSSKIGTRTVVLREAYKRGVLIEKHPIMEMRNQYIRLMNTVKEAPKLKNRTGRSQLYTTHDSQSRRGEMDRDGSGDEEDGELSSGHEDTSDDDDVEIVFSRSRRSNAPTIKHTSLKTKYIKGSLRSPLRERSITKSNDPSSSSMRERSITNKTKDKMKPEGLSRGKTSAGCTGLLKS